jgi:hypothetical protein
VGVLRGESVGIADGSFNMRRFERLSAAKKSHSSFVSLRHSDVGSSPGSGPNEVAIVKGRRDEVVPCATWHYLFLEDNMLGWPITRMHGVPNDWLTLVSGANAGADGLTLGGEAERDVPARRRQAPSARSRLRNDKNDTVRDGEVPWAVGEVGGHFLGRS